MRDPDAFLPLCQQPGYLTQSGAPHEQEFCTCPDCGDEPLHEEEDDR